MFEQKYTRLKFWIISILLFISTGLLLPFVKAFELYGLDALLRIIMLLLLVVWINTLANRIRDFGSNPWYSVLALLPGINLGMTFYYGIIKNNRTIASFINNFKDSKSFPLIRAVINHIKSISNQYIEKHS